MATPMTRRVEWAQSMWSLLVDGKLFGSVAYQEVTGTHGESTPWAATISGVNAVMYFPTLAEAQAALLARVEEAGDG